MRNDAAPTLAQAGGAIGAELRAALARVAEILLPEADWLEASFIARLRHLKYGPRERRALAALTLGNASRFLGRGRSLEEFFEEVEYNGRRLAKLNLPPAATLQALREYGRLLQPVLGRLLTPQPDRFAWAREQAQFFVMLTLNDAYYQVREAETQAFYEMFGAELNSASLDELLAGFLEILARSCRASRALLFLHDPQRGYTSRAGYGATAARADEGPARALLDAAALSTPRSFTIGVRSASYLLDPRWRPAFRTCWSVPLKKADHLLGVLQFAFDEPYDWLPREVDLLSAAAERCVLAIEKTQLMESLASQRSQIRTLAETLTTVEEAERRRLSRELHDQTGQDLLWIRLQMELLESELPEAGNPWRARVARIRDTTERTIAEIRRLIAALSPAVLEQLGLAPALRQLVNRFRSAYPAKVRLRIGPVAAMNKQAEILVYRLVQECLNNIAKHSSCSTVAISIETAGEHLRLDVRDNGVGFNLDEALNQAGSFGLAGIRERVALMGGACTIRSHPARPAGQRRQVAGTRIQIELPLKAITGDGEHRKPPLRFLNEPLEHAKQSVSISR